MGFKYSSELFEIRASVTESAANTFTEEEIQINLDSLNREILVIMSVDLDIGNPDLIAGSSTATNGSLTKTSQSNTVGISNPACIAEIRKDCKSLAAPDAQAVTYVDALPVLDSDGLPYLSILATDNAFLGMKGTNNGAARNASVLIKARRARADADTYAALVTSEAGLN